MNTKIPPGEFQREDVYIRKRWRSIQYLANNFWTRWKKEYLTLLQQRQKWNTPKRNITVGDVIIIKEDNVCRNQWSMGRVIDTESDHEGYVRSVSVKTQSGELKRPISKVVLLVPVDS